MRSFVLVICTDWCVYDPVSHKQDVHADNSALEVIENHADAPCVRQICQKQDSSNRQIRKHAVGV